MAHGNSRKDQSEWYELSFWKVLDMAFSKMDPKKKQGYVEQLKMLKKPSLAASYLQDELTKSGGVEKCSLMGGCGIGRLNENMRSNQIALRSLRWV